jgi:hypothetical protein
MNEHLFAGFGEADRVQRQNFFVFLSIRVFPVRLE